MNFNFVLNGDGSDSSTQLKLDILWCSSSTLIALAYIFKSQ